MMGSAFARYERRGTLCKGWLRRIYSLGRGRSGGEWWPSASETEAGG